MVIYTCASVRRQWNQEPKASIWLQSEFQASQGHIRFRWLPVQEMRWWKSKTGLMWWCSYLNTHVCEVGGAESYVPLVTVVLAATGGSRDTNTLWQTLVLRRLWRKKPIQEVPFCLYWFSLCRATVSAQHTQRHSHLTSKTERYNHITKDRKFTSVL